MLYISLPALLVVMFLRLILRQPAAAYTVFLNLNPADVELRIVGDYDVRLACRRTGNTQFSINTYPNVCSAAVMSDRDM